MSVFKLLLEYAELVADGIPRRLEAERGHTVHIARRETPETAVAKPGVRLRLEYVGRIAPHILQRARDRLGYAEVEGVLHQASAHEKLHGHVVHFFFRVLGVLRHVQAAHYLADDYRGRLKYLLVGSLGAGDAEMRAELILYRAADLFA